MGADQYGVWDTDANGNYVSVSQQRIGESATLVSMETSFNEDLNGDGIDRRSAVRRVIESSGSMSLVTDWTNYYLEPNGGTAVKLSYGGRRLRSANLAPGLRSRRSRRRPDMRWPWRMWAPINIRSGTRTAAAISSRVRSANVSGTSAALESMEFSFNDDLNGDGTIGIPVPSGATTIEFIRHDQSAGEREHLSPPGGKRRGGSAELWRAAGDAPANLAA